MDNWSETSAPYSPDGDVSRHLYDHVDHEFLPFSSTPPPTPYMEMQDPLVPEADSHRKGKEPALSPSNATGAGPSRTRQPLSPNAAAAAGPSRITLHPPRPSNPDRTRQPEFHHYNLSQSGQGTPLLFNTMAVTATPSLSGTMHSLPPQLNPGGLSSNLGAITMHSLPPQLNPGGSSSNLGAITMHSLPPQLNPGGSSSNSGAIGPSGTREPVFQWVLPGQLNCRNCNVLGQVCQSSELHDLLLSIHGGVGTIEHIILDVQNRHTRLNEQYYLDISCQTLLWLQHFLVRYHIGITPEGCLFASSPDSLWAIYNSLECRRQQFQVNQDEVNQFLSSSPMLFQSLNLQPEMPTIPQFNEPVPRQPRASNPHIRVRTRRRRNLNQGIRPHSNPGQNVPHFQAPVDRALRPHVGIQRERTANMTVDDLRPLFHLRTFEACEALNICHSAFKGLCRRLRLRRWPFRKIQSLRSQIEDKEVQRDTSMQRNDAEGAYIANQEILQLRREMDNLYNFPFLEPDQPTEEEYEEAQEENEGRNQADGV